METTRTASFGSSADVGPDAALAAPYLAIVMNFREPTTPGARYSIAEVANVEIGRGARRAALRSRRDGTDALGIELPDIWLSGRHARIVRDNGIWFVEDAGSRNGTVVNGERVERRLLADGDLIELGATIVVFRDAVHRELGDAIDVELDASDDALATLSVALARDFSQLARIAPTTAGVLLLGPSGSGKEYVARAIHTRSGRAGPFHAVNCGAIAPTLVEAELFGHRRGAFSGADAARPGHIRAADGGTLLLDEIGELSADAQVALLRVLQEAEVVPVGETRASPVDVRVIAATHRDLDALRADGRFRDDLYARLAGYELELPPVAHRREDLGMFVAASMRRHAANRDVRFDRRAARALFCYDWPLNIRELDQALSAAVALADGDEIRLSHLPKPLRAAAKRPVPRPVVPDPRKQITALLRHHHGNVSAVARDLGRSRVHTHRVLKKLGIDPADFRQK